MDRTETQPQDRGRANDLAGTRSYPKIAIICLWSHPELLSALTVSCRPMPVTPYDGRHGVDGGIVATYNHALQTIEADFFLFCHQDVAGNVPQLIETSIDFIGPKDVVGAIGKTKKNASVWRHDGDPVEVQTLDECCFGFYKKSGYTFDPQLRWTNYSQDICLLAHSQGGKVWVPPNNIGHAQHKWGHWFIKQGHFAKELTHVRHKWGGFRRS